MSDQSLREALGVLAADWRSQPHDPDSTAITVMRHCGAQIAGALADHPAEPAPVQVEVPDEAVAAALEVINDDGHNGIDCRIPDHPERGLDETVRAALEAAAPLLGPRPLLDRDEVVSAVTDAACQFAGSSGSADACNDAVKPAVDTVMELARPMPTSEVVLAMLSTTLFHCFDHEEFGLSAKHATAVADRIMALLNGAES